MLVCEPFRPKVMRYVVCTMTAPAFNDKEEIQ